MPVILALVVFAIPLFAEVTFSGLDLSSDGKLLFKGTADIPGHGTYDTLFLARLGASGVKEAAFSQLSFFPERIMYLKGSAQLQIQNRFGIFRTGKDFSPPSPVANFQAFITGGDIQTGSIYPVNSSSDGRYILFLTPVSAAYGDLSLLDTQNGVITLISRRIGLSLSGPPVSWAPDSKYFVYEKEDGLYYYSIAHLRENRILNEDFRKIGSGSIRSIRWSADNDLFFITSSLVYRIGSAEFFTRSLYSGFLDVGSVIGKIPFTFDPNFDTFWISPDSAKFSLTREGRTSFCTTSASTIIFRRTAQSNCRICCFPGSTVVQDILWTSRDSVTILTGTIENGKNATNSTA